MIRTVMKLGVACALGLFGLAGFANAASPLAALHGAPILIPVIDENTAVEEHLEPEVVPPGSQEDSAEPKKEEPVEKAPKKAEPESGADDDVGAQEIQEQFPTEKYPPSMEEK